MYGIKVIDLLRIPACCMCMSLDSLVGLGAGNPHGSRLVGWDIYICIYDLILHEDFAQVY